MMLGFLLARAGIDVVVVEKHADFLRDFRGDTVHPSTLQVMYELGLLDALLKRPHQEVVQGAAEFGETRITLADFLHLPTRCKFVAFMPQWEFLDFLAGQGRALPSFHLLMETEVHDLAREDGRIAGVRARGPQGDVEIRAPLTVGCDGRHSVVRQRAGLDIREFGAPIDVLWLRIPRREDDEHQVLGRVEPGRFFIMLDRGDYWQCAFVIPKGGFDAIRARGIDAFRQDVARLARAEPERVAGIASWDDVKLLTVKVDRLSRWHAPGLLCIGDAAHAMSPIGGVGINLAIQDAVAAANILADPLRSGRVDQATLHRVQQRRTFPTWATQRMQILIQNRLLAPVLAGRGPVRPPWLLSLANRYPILRQIPARIIGLGFRPEHVAIR